MAGAPLGWGVKQSFRNYVESAGGSIEAGAGAVRDEDGAFAFEPVEGAISLDADGKPQGVAAFAGELEFDAHGGMLKVFMADPVVEIGPDGAQITFFDTPGRDRRVALAVLDLGAMTRSDTGALVIPTKMSKDGWKILGDHYLPSTPLDPLVLRVG